MYESIEVDTAYTTGNQSHRSNTLFSGELPMRYRRFLTLPILLFILSISFSYGQNSYRDRQMQPDKIMDVIGVKSGMVIGEAGAGEGYFTFKLSRRVGETGRIYANDIESKALKVIQDRCQKEKIENITTVLGEVTDPLFSREKLDLVFMIAAFHDFEKPVEWLENVKAYMKPEATLVIVEKDPGKSGYSSDHHMTEEEILETLEKGGFQLVKMETFLEDDNIFIYRIPD
jgi:predicted methyltransferase